ncbi:GNAT family N-acetyltransferase [Catellatospora citrea]|uniref:N-acetyltransferase domain-containing protein n=1 Tax=Catellatospora citrea TaxID=53366 RepID=A0A8J3KX94_9ACTN|nr:GNAT family N-acetyltransferase [Catellatospora citrea]RKE10610.1 acetyltransferase (GNAT) family protein [Catellatospora citrea]GIG02895.1 hypothetical protein Cci01nite_79880 [Catellatospora citrea]
MSAHAAGLAPSTTQRPDQGVQIRPWLPRDVDLLRQAHHRLSPQTIWQRFGLGGSTLPRAYLRMICRQSTELDAPRNWSMMVAHHDDVLVGWAEARPNRHGQHELAVVVVDAWQGRGVGSRLANAILAECVRSGAAVYACIHPGNVAAHRLVVAAARGVSERTLRHEIQDGLVHYVLDRSADTPSSAGVALRNAPDLSAGVGPDPKPRPVGPLPALLGDLAAVIGLITESRRMKRRQ